MLLQASALILGSIFASCLFAQLNEGAQDQRQDQTQTNGQSTLELYTRWVLALGPRPPEPSEGLGQQQKVLAKVPPTW